MAILRSGSGADIGKASFYRKAARLLHRSIARAPYPKWGFGASLAAFLPDRGTKTLRADGL